LIGWRLGFRHGADGRDAHPYMARMAFAGGLGLAVGGLMRWTSRDAGPYLGWLGQHAVLPLPEAGGLSWGDGLQGRRVEVAQRVKCDGKWTWFTSMRAGTQGQPIRLPAPIIYLALASQAASGRRRANVS
jgi:hypothetical protein